MCVATQYASAHCKMTISSQLFARWQCCSGITISSYLFARWNLFRHVSYLRHQQQADLRPFDLESGVRVTCDVGYLCANFSLLRPLCSWVRPNVRNRQTDVRQKHHLMPPPNGGEGIIRSDGYLYLTRFNHVTFDDLDDFERQTLGANYLDTSSICAHSHHLTNGKQIRHGSPSTQQTGFRVDLASHNLKGRGTSSTESFGTYTCPHGTARQPDFTRHQTKCGYLLQNATHLPSLGWSARGQKKLTPLHMTWTNADAWCVCSSWPFCPKIASFPQVPLKQRDGRLSWPGWLVSESLPIQRQSPIPLTGLNIRQLRWSRPTRYYYTKPPRS